ncbi:MAG: hypothetical protein JXB05_02475 [Myxococcaceae bacterium]|nr:hypothetical protein [Myxococcaceae bacterium]
MALNPSALKTQLEQGWLNASFPENVAVSADRFASAVASWFSAAQAAGFPCTTAMARQSQLSGQLATALNAGSAASAGQALASALAAYMTGQLFGAGSSAAPTGTSAAATALIAAFSDLNPQTPNALRAQQIATACQALAVTTLVTFPPSVPPIPPSPVM